MRVWTLLILVACSDKSGDEGAAAEPQITGTIGLEGEAESGKVALYKGFGVDAGGTMMAYLSSNPDSTCGDVFDYLAADDEPYDPSGLIRGGTCDIFLHFEGYSSPLEAANDPLVGASTVINCAMGEGSFELETRDDTDYYWSGRWWQGHPTQFSLGLSGGDGEGYSLDLELGAWEGNFIYEGLTRYAGAGSVSGSLDIEWCGQLGTVGVF